MVEKLSYSMNSAKEDDGDKVMDAHAIMSLIVKSTMFNKSRDNPL